MVWRLDDPQCNESKKIVWEVAPYLRGRGIDIGAGDFKVLPHVISVDNCHHESFGFSIKPDVKVENAVDLKIFGSQSMDFVYSSHTLEHIEDYKAALQEWWRLVKMDGYLILYLPHKNFYPNIGHPHANPDHKHDFLPNDIIEAMYEVPGAFDMVECQERNEDMEYSMLLVFQKIQGRIKKFSYRDPKPEKTALVCRFGAFGDLMQATSVFAGLKKQGYHVTLMASEPGVDVVRFDPNIDKIMLLDKDQIPNANLPDFWAWQAKKYDKFVNLSESVEGTFLAMAGRSQAGWPAAVRHARLNYNYVQFQHELAGVPHEPEIKFYATDDEKQWAAKTRAKMGKQVIMWSLAGSSVHKTWAGLDNILAAIMLDFPEAHVVLVGGPECVMLEAGWENEPRIIKTSGKWSIRQTLAFLEHCDLVIGPETGVLNAAACMDMTKIIFLSHSTVENLTRDWKNTISLFSKNTKCAGRGNNEAPACHMLHFGFSTCTRDEETGTAQCQRDIPVEEVYEHVHNVLSKVK